MWRDEHGCAEMFFKFVAFYYGDCESYADIMLIILSSYEDLYLKTSKTSFEFSKALSRPNGQFESCSDAKTYLICDINIKEEPKQTISLQDIYLSSEYLADINNGAEQETLSVRNDDTIIIDDDSEIHHSFVNSAKSNNNVMPELLLDNNRLQRQQQEMPRHHQVVTNDNKLDMDDNNEDQNATVDDSIQYIDIKEEVATGEILLHDNVQPCSSTDNTDSVVSRTSRVSNFRRSRSIHAAVKVSSSIYYKCHICDKSCLSDYALRMHSRVHTGQRPFQCDICGQAFRQRQNLKSHVLKTHLGAKPHVCPFCGKGFGYKHHLDGHKRIHTGEKPFACVVCGKAFADNSNFNRHMMTLHSL